MAMVLLTWMRFWCLDSYRLGIAKIGRVNLVRALTDTSSASEEPSQWVVPGHVYFVATPIGNKFDICQRAASILSDVDVVVAEDTRQTIDLLRKLNLPHKKLTSHHEYNQPSSIPHIINLAKSMQSVAVVSDAGTPGISDPGALLAAALAAAEVPLHPIPGPSSVIAALSISGFPASEFTFLGFLAVKGKERREKIEKIKACLHTVVFFEAPHRIMKTFIDLTANDVSIKDRLCVCCRELTKKHEEIKRGTVQDVLTWLQETQAAHEGGSGVGIRGEFTIVLGPVNEQRSEDWRALKQETAQESEESSIVSSNKVGSGVETTDLRSRVRQMLLQLRDQGMKRSEAVKAVAEQLKAPRGVIYSLALKEEW
eukprot:gene37120-45059_t